MKKGLLEVLKNCVALITFLIVIDFLVGYAGEKYIRWMNSNPRVSESALVNYDLNAAIPDVAIIGSSTATCHYDPDIVRDSLLSYTNKDYSVFNMGMSNQKLTYCSYALKSLLDRKTPKIVIIDVWASFVGNNPTEHYLAYRPYVNINSRVKDLLSSHNEYSFLMKSNMYCFNTELVKLLLAQLKPVGANGFSKNYSEMAEITKKNECDTSELLTISKEEFDYIINASKQADFKLFIVLSPTLRSSDTKSRSYQYMKEKCFECDIPFLDYSNDESFYKKELFRDEVHLNYYGAEIFTKQLMGDIKKYISI